MAKADEIYYSLLASVRRAAERDRDTSGHPPAERDAEFHERIRRNGLLSIAIVRRSAKIVDDVDLLAECNAVEVLVKKTWPNSD